MFNHLFIIKTCTHYKQEKLTIYRHEPTCNKQEEITEIRNQYHGHFVTFYVENIKMNFIFYTF